MGEPGGPSYAPTTTERNEMAVLHGVRRSRRTAARAVAAAAGLALVLATAGCSGDDGDGDGDGGGDGDARGLERPADDNE